MITIENTHEAYSEDVPAEFYIGLYWEFCYRICLDGRPVGKIFLIDGEEGSAYGGADCIYIQWVELQESERGKGYIRNVVECLKKEFRHKKYITAQSSDEHLDMYLHIGFESTGRDPCTFYEMSNIRISV